MTTDRKTLLEHHAKATAILRHPDAPDHLRALAKKARDKSALVLGLQDAMARKKAKMAAAEQAAATAHRRDE